MMADGEMKIRETREENICPSIGHIHGENRHLPT